MKKVIYSYINNNESRHIVDYLHKKHKWRPVAFHGYASMKSWVDERYPLAKLADSQKLRQGNFDFSEIIMPIDSEIIKNLSPYQSNYISWLQDTTGWNFSYNERLRYYYDILKYWNTIINESKPDIFISYTWPHLPSDFALYLLCKYHYKIPVLYMDIVPQLDNSYFSVGCCLEDLSLPYEKYYTSDKECKLSTDVISYLNKLRSNSPSMPRHVIEYFKILDSKNKRRFIYFSRTMIGLFTGASYKTSQTFKKNKYRWGDKRSLLNRFEEYFFWSGLSNKNKINKLIYKRYTEKADFNKKYIYFAAPYQPEAISNINQGCYEDPFLILDILESVVPDDYVIYYKEHPNIFKDADKGALYRDEEYYKKLHNYKKVKMIPIDTNTFSLIDNSISVATVGGTVGWEAVVRGKPAIVFGTIWYQICSGVYKITDLNSAKEALSQIMNGAKPVNSLVDKFAQSIYMSSEKGVITVTGFNKKIEQCENVEKEMHRIAEMFVLALKKLY
jgi:hypothetical protein